MEPVGSRVGAILGTDADKPKTLNFFGYGVYDGDLPNGPMGQFPNPRITLDSGEVVWGCECWWGAEERIKQELEYYKKQGYTIETVTVAAAKGESQ